MKYLINTLILFLFCPAFALAQAQTPQFFFPLGCSLGIDCWTVNYVDIDPASNAAKDFNCGAKTLNDNNGTDFGFRDFNATVVGIDVLAAAEGTISRVRDGESDGEKTPAQLDNIRAAKKECGNAVLIDHGHGWQSLYCHLRGGTIVVKSGDHVTAGQKIAQAGQSGVAAFPQLHFGLVHNAKAIDPYTGHTPDSTCGADAHSLWSLGLPMKYEPLSLFAAEFFQGTPDFTQIKKQADPVSTLTIDHTSLSFWAGIYNVQKDDVIHLTITGPDGKDFAKSRYTQNTNQQRQYYFTGRDHLGHLQPGLYKAEAVLSRGELNQTISRTLEIH